MAASCRIIHHWTVWAVRNLCITSDAGIVLENVSPLACLASSAGQADWATDLDAAANFALNCASLYD